MHYLGGRLGPRQRGTDRQLVEANRTAIAIDLGRVSYLDSTALTALLQTQKQAEASCWQLAVVKPQDYRVWRMFELTALSTRFTFFDSRAAAILSVALTSGARA